MTIADLGELGEQEARSRLERALQGTGLRLSGASDKGLDMIVQFEAPWPDRIPLHFGVQVKTGDSFARLERGRWKMQGLSPSRFAQWTRSPLPVLFLWVRPAEPAECYWALVKKGTPREHFSISRRAHVNPTIRYDLALEFARREDSHGELKAKLLLPPLKAGLRAHAKAFYKAELMTASVIHPIAGNIRFTWKGWRHLTGQGRPQRHIHHSLQLLRVARDAVVMARQFLGLRRLANVTRGAWSTEVRLLIFKGPTAHFEDRAPADLTIALREVIHYPVGWLTDVRLHEKTQRFVTFESIYEKRHK